MATKNNPNNPFIRAARERGELSIKSGDPWTDDSLFETTKTPADDLYRYVAWVYRCVDIGANAASTMPFDLYNKRGDIVASSEKWVDPLGWLPDPAELFGKLAASRDVFGNAYLFRTRSVAKTLSVRYIVPTTITVNIKQDGTFTFTRTVEGMPKDYTADDIVYFWGLDPHVELGPAQSSPLDSVLASAGVLKNLAAFKAAYFERGAIKMTMLMVDGMPEKEESELLKSWWRNMMTGVRQAFGMGVFRNGSVTPVVVGEGIGDLENEPLDRVERETIASGMAIPHSILFSGAANYAVSQQDWRNLYDFKVTPVCKWLATNLNNQLLNKLGYHLEFAPERLPYFQVDEAGSVAALQGYVDLGLTLPEAAAVLGVTLSDDIIKRLEAKAKAEQAAPVVINTPPAPQPDNTAEIVAKWRRFALKRGVAKKAEILAFDQLPALGETGAAIAERIKSANTNDDIRAAFDVGGVKAEPPSDAAMVLEGIREAIAALQVV